MVDAFLFRIKLIINVYRKVNKRVRILVFYFQIIFIFSFNFQAFIELIFLLFFWYQNADTLLLQASMNLIISQQEKINFI